MKNNLIPISCPLACSFLWGTTFVAQDTGMDFIGPYTFCAVRLFLGFLGLLPFFLYFEFNEIKKINFNLKIESTIQLKVDCIGKLITSILNDSRGWIKVT